MKRFGFLMGTVLLLYSAVGSNPQSYCIMGESRDVCARDTPSRECFGTINFLTAKFDVNHTFKTPSK